MDGLLERNPWVTRRKLDVAAYHRMAEAGILTEDDRVELIEGEIIAMVPIGGDHVGMVNWLNRAMMRAVGDRAEVSVQNPVRLSDLTEPQPDLVLLKPLPTARRRRDVPLATDVLLLIEVADSSLRYDSGVKLPLYAAHGVPEVWILDLRGQVIEAHREPFAAGYRSTVRAVAGDTLEPALLPGLHIAVSDILG